MYGCLFEVGRGVVFFVAKSVRMLVRYALRLKSRKKISEEHVVSKMKVRSLALARLLANLPTEARVFLEELERLRAHLLKEKKS